MSFYSSIDWSDTFPNRPSMSDGERAFFHGRPESVEADSIREFRQYATESPRKQRRQNSRFANTEPEFNQNIWTTTETHAAPNPGASSTHGRQVWIPDYSLPVMRRNDNHHLHTDTSKVIADLLYPTVNPSAMGMNRVVWKADVVEECPVCKKLIDKYFEDVEDHVESRHSLDYTVCGCGKWVKREHLAFHIAATHFFCDEVQCRSCAEVVKKREFPDHLAICPALVQFRDHSKAIRVDQLLSRQPPPLRRPIGPTEIIPEIPLTSSPMMDRSRGQSSSTPARRHRTPSISSSSSPLQTSQLRFNPMKSPAREVPARAPSVDPETWTPHQYYGGKYPAASYDARPPAPQHLMDAFLARKAAQEAAERRLLLVPLPVLLLRGSSPLLLHAPCEIVSAMPFAELTGTLSWDITHIALDERTNVPSLAGTLLITNHADNNQWGTVSRSIVTNPSDHPGSPAEVCVTISTVEISFSGDPTCQYHNPTYISKTNNVTTSGELVGTNGSVAIALALGFSSTSSFTVSSHRCNYWYSDTLEVKIGFPDVTDVSESVTNTQTSSFETTYNDVDTITVTMTAADGETCNAISSVTSCTLQATGQIQYLASGWIWFNYDNKTNGHYKWSVNIEAVITDEADRSSYADFTGSVETTTHANYQETRS
ncbi:hypothetical protein BT96DRAFT_991516 [Gymnopus androsaceus JB14]|uniref:Uncharacterized protein n=1 Tax=Gymnopus androsaceus JB14 TaxID=1447944 RepID=A0A6A4HZ30_9AGAR|nr:hypothetical protein BT96DRAFT_991516 [Gymnopus androsaceus JB14]